MVIELNEGKFWLFALMGIQITRIYGNFKNLYSVVCGEIFQETFAEYTARTAFERPLLSGVAYAEKVVNFEREMFERQHNWVIKTMDRGEPSPVRDEYAPVIFSQDSVSYLESLDMMSGEVT